MKKILAVSVICVLFAAAAAADPASSVNRLVESLARDALAAADEPVVGRIPVSLLSIRNEGAAAQANYVGEAVRALAKKALGLSLVFYEVERENLDAALQEMELALSGVVDESTIPEIGNVIGVRYLIAGSVTETATDFLVTLQLVSVETAAIVSSAQATIPRRDMIAAAEAAAFEYVAANGVGLGADWAFSQPFTDADGSWTGPSFAGNLSLLYRFSREWKFSLSGMYSIISLGKDQGIFGSAANFPMRDLLLAEIDIGGGMIPVREPDGSITSTPIASILQSQINLDRSMSFAGIVPTLYYVLPFTREFSLNVGLGIAFGIATYQSTGFMPGLEEGAFLSHSFVVIDLWKLAVGGRAELSFEWFIAPRLALSFGCRFSYEYVLYEAFGTYATVNNSRLDDAKEGGESIMTSLFGYDPFSLTDGSPAFEGTNPMSLDLFLGVVAYF